MKKIYRIGFMLVTAFCLVSCNYLDIVPDEREQEEDAFKDIEAARRFLYSCYAYYPMPNDAVNSMDFMTGDEVITSFEHEAFANFPKGNFTAVSPGISYWNTLFAGIRQCYILQANLEKVPGLEAETREDYLAQIDFLIGYYHLLLTRCYGPVILVEEMPDINTKPEDYLSRRPLADCIKFITDKFDAAAEKLPDIRTDIEVGLATSVVAKSLKAYILMYYASPLFNGNSELAGKLVNTDGTALMDPTGDPQRWVIARDAYLDAIKSAEAAGHALYERETPAISNKYPENEHLRVLRGNLVSIVKFNKEEIWVSNKAEGASGLQKKSMPFVNETCYNGVCPTMAMLDRFYTVNGLPYNVDPQTKDLDKYTLIKLDEQNSVVTFADGSIEQVAETGQETSLLNLNREPRYYAWVAFQGGYYEVTNASFNGGYDGEESMKKYGKHKLVMNFLINGNCGRGERNNNYSPGGFLNKKGVHPDNVVGKKGSVTMKKYPFPLIRLSELYLGYAECCAEVGGAEDLINAKYYLNLVRARAGIPDVETSWNLVGGIRDSKHLRDIVRQERQIELYLECHNFWDMRRWKLADQYFNKRHHGLNIDADNMKDFSVDYECPFVREFRDYHWLLPIPAKDINNNHNIVQNPGY